MMHRGLVAGVFAAVLGFAPARAVARVTCELNGVYFNQDHGDSKIGKTGMVQCRDADTGELKYERELRDGKYIGLERSYRRGVLAVEQTVNESGNRDGLAREFAATTPKNPVLRHEHYRNGQRVGNGRTFYASGKLQRLTAYGDKGRELAAIEWNETGEIRRVTCSDKPVFGLDYNDAVLCGHGAKPNAVDLYDSKGLRSARSVYAQGKRVSHETFWESGKLETQRQAAKDREVERRFSERGVKLYEVLWVGPERDRRKSIEQEFYDSGSPKRERMWKEDTLTLERDWYMNGQKRTVIQATTWENQPARREQHFDDEGKLRSERFWLLQPYGGRPLPVGVHKDFGEDGRVAREEHYDATGTRVRERSWKDGRLVRDDELFPDGSRKSHRK